MAVFERDTISNDAARREAGHGYKRIQRDSRRPKIELAIDAFHATKRQMNLGGAVVCRNKKPQISKR